MKKQSVVSTLSPQGAYPVSNSFVLNQSGSRGQKRAQGINRHFWSSTHPSRKVHQWLPLFLFPALNESLAQP